MSEELREEPRPIDLWELGSRLDMPTDWLYRAAKRGDIPCLKLNSRRFLFNLQAVRKALWKLAGEGTTGDEMKNSVTSDESAESGA